jgi:asparagine synthase (glutamine-hydrolysing)
MCGICGVFDLRGDAVERSLVERMSVAMEHRGPDGHGVHMDGAVGLGHRRLSIIDVEGGGQPFSNEARTLHLVFNGEIYNFLELRQELEERGHVFKTRSDTEVILRAYEHWGRDCVKRFNGMFAFALWDRTRQQLFMARDHLGVKPLYYVHLGRRILFASEVKALLAEPQSPRAVNLKALGQLFTLRYVPSPATLFDGIHKLPPGHCMTVSTAGVKVERFWTRTPAVCIGQSEEDLVERYQCLLEDAVRLQMRSDVPVGLFLSSGLDSSALLVLMSRYSREPVCTFTIGFEGGDANETADARELAGWQGARHEEMIVGASDYEKYFERYLWDLEEPVGNETAAAFYFVSHLAGQRVKVALSGQGADEPWAGYHRHLGFKVSRYYSALPAMITERGIRPLIEQFATSERLLRAVDSLAEPDLLTRLVKVYSFYSPAMKERLFLPWLRAEVSADGAEARDALRTLQSEVGKLDPLTQMLYIDTRTNLPDDLLMVSDKTSMANSVEARVPYLDHRIVEFIETLPASLKLRRTTGKYLHKKALEKWLPREVVYREKKGFANPIDRWLKDRLGSYAANRLLSDGSAVARYFDRGYIAELLGMHARQGRSYMRQIYLLLSFELWHQRFIG